MTNPDKLNLQSLNNPDEKREELLRIFPEVRTEGGQIDFDRLRLALGDMVDTGKERYGLNWPGKSACFKAIQTPSMGTLLPAPEESVNFDTTENLIIEGGNLEALKLLQKSYIGKVKMIYIDPPYNTGNESWVYNDNVNSPDIHHWLGEVVGKEGETLDRHDRWLCMMYPRLVMLKQFLRKDGAIFISIDDNEVGNLQALMREVFSAANEVATIVWQGGKKGDSKLVSVAHEYIVVFARDKAFLKERQTKWRRKKAGADEVLEFYQDLRAKLDGDHDDQAPECVVEEGVRP